MKKRISYGLLLVFLLGSLSSNAQQKRNTSELTTKWIDAKLLNAVEQYKDFALRIPKGFLPRSFTFDTLRTCAAESWVAGFYPGTLFCLYQATKDKAMWDEGLKRVQLLEKQQYNNATHDLGFMMLCSYGNLYKLQPSRETKQILINSAKALATRFNPTVGCIRSWGRREDTSEFRVIIDNMMNLELLLWAAKETGDQSLYNIAVTHANTTMKNHFRPDYSSYHVVVFNPISGTVIKKQTAQGAADESAWSRGQAWGLYGYTMMYRATGDKNYLKQAQHIASFISSNPNLPQDRIPYWDYNAPGIPAAFRDASAAAIMASALLELADYSEKDLAKQYRKTAAIMLQTLSTPEYTAGRNENGGFLLKHSVAHLPKNTEVDAPQSYADYYYIEALIRYKNYLKGGKIK